MNTPTTGEIRPESNQTDSFYVYFYNVMSRTTSPNALVVESISPRFETRAKAEKFLTAMRPFYPTDCYVAEHCAYFSSANDPERLKLLSTIGGFAEKNAVQATVWFRNKPNHEARPAAQQPENTLETIRQKFMAIARSADMVLLEGEHEQLTGSALIHLQCDAEELAALCRQMRDQLCGQSVHGQNGYTETPRKVSLDEVLAIQAIERGITPMPLEADLLIPRIEQGGHSGKFLADAFISSYRPHPFNHPLTEVNRLDAEAFRLFHQCIHIRHVPGWSDSALYEIEKRVRAAMKEGGKQNRRATRSGIAKVKAGLEVKGGE